MSFLQRLKKGGVKSADDTVLSSPEKETAADTVAQLNVDVYQTDSMMVVYAQSAGADMNDVRVSIEGEAKIILIEGNRIRPEYIAPSKKTVDSTIGAFIVEECEWGDFYRRIILPESVNIEKAEAKIKNGVLILNLPFLKDKEKDKEKIHLKVTDGQAVLKPKPKN